jgi:hypothetical protein
MIRRYARALASHSALLRGQRGQRQGLARSRLDGRPAGTRVRTGVPVWPCPFGPRLSERDGARARPVRRAARHARAREVVVRLVPPRRQDDRGWLWTAQHAPHGPAQPPAKARKRARPVPRYRSPVNHEPVSHQSRCLAISLHRPRHNRRDPRSPFHIQGPQTSPCPVGRRRTLAPLEDPGAESPLSPLATLRPGRPAEETASATTSPSPSGSSPQHRDHVWVIGTPWTLLRIPN